MTLPIRRFLPSSERRGEVFPGIFGRVCAARFSNSWSYFRLKNVIFNTRFQTEPLKSIPVSDLV